MNGSNSQLSASDLYNFALIMIFAVSPLVFILLRYLKAPYGRHTRGGWGPMINAKAAWIIMESPSLLIMPLMFIYSGAKPVLLVFTIIWLAHYFQRTLIYPMLMGPGSAAMPLSIVLLSITFNLMNASVNSYYLFYLSDYSYEWFFTPQFICGCIIFAAGYIINIKSDSILRGLRKPGGPRYVIPEAGLFKYVSAPNYLGEILEWTGWAVLTWSLPGLTFMIFTIANLAPRAAAHHSWYLEKFPDYPRQRKILIPLLY